MLSDDSVSEDCTNTKLIKTRIKHRNKQFDTKTLESNSEIYKTFNTSNTYESQILNFNNVEKPKPKNKSKKVVINYTNIDNPYYKNASYRSIFEPKSNYTNTLNRICSETESKIKAIDFYNTTKKSTDFNLFDISNINKKDDIYTKVRKVKNSMDLNNDNHDSTSISKISNTKANDEGISIYLSDKTINNDTLNNKLTHNKKDNNIKIRNEYVVNTEVNENKDIDDKRIKNASSFEKKKTVLSNLPLINNSSHQTNYENFRRNVIKKQSIKQFMDRNALKNMTAIINTTEVKKNIEDKLNNMNKGVFNSKSFVIKNSHKDIKQCNTDLTKSMNKIATEAKNKMLNSNANEHNEIRNVSKKASFNLQKINFINDENTLVNYNSNDYNAKLSDNDNNENIRNINYNDTIKTVKTKISKVSFSPNTRTKKNKLSLALSNSSLTKLSKLSNNYNSNTNSNMNINNTIPNNPISKNQSISSPYNSTEQSFLRKINKKQSKKTLVDVSLIKIQDELINNNNTNIANLFRDYMTNNREGSNPQLDRLMNLKQETEMENFKKEAEAEIKCIEMRLEEYSSEYNEIEKNIRGKKLNIELLDYQYKNMDLGIFNNQECNQMSSLANINNTNFEDIKKPKAKYNSTTSTANNTNYNDFDRKMKERSQLKLIQQRKIEEAEFHESQIKLLLIKKMEIQETIKQTWEELDIVKQAYHKVKHELLSYYQTVLKDGRDFRNDGLSWVITAIYKLGFEVDIKQLPCFLDKQAIEYLFKKTQIEIKIEEIHLEMRSKKFSLKMEHMLVKEKNLKKLKGEDLIKEKELLKKQMNKITNEISAYLNSNDNTNNNNNHYNYVIRNEGNNKSYFGNLMSEFKEYENKFISLNTYNSLNNGSTVNIRDIGQISDVGKSKKNLISSGVLDGEVFKKKENVNISADELRILLQNAKNFKNEYKYQELRKKFKNFEKYNSYYSINDVSIFDVLIFM